ncbi:MAG: hypothetical protein K2X82_13935 [Gemmataceae bacterium]|nr:hypothetical protein [Gemmataceae bacterium]
MTGTGRGVSRESDAGILGSPAADRRESTPMATAAPADQEKTGLGNYFIVS